MPRITYPTPYNKETHKLLNDVEFYSILPDKPLQAFLVQRFSTPLKKILLNAENFVEVTKTYTGYNSLYFEVKIDDELYYGLASKYTLEGSIPNFQLIVPDRIQLIPKQPNANPLSQAGYVPFTDFFNSWINEPELRIKTSPTNELYISVPLTQYNSTGNNEELLQKAKEALVIGTQFILKEYGKKFSEEFVNSILFGDNTRKAFFEFTKVLDYYLDPRGADNCSYIKFLVVVPKNFVESIDDYTPGELAGSREGVDVDGDAAEDLSRLGAGDLQSAVRFLYIRSNDFEEFIAHIDLVKRVILHYNEQQNLFLGNFIDNHVCLSDVQSLKEESELDLAKEAAKFDVFVRTVEKILTNNKVPLKNKSSERDISVNKIVFGFDDEYNIVYIEAIRNGISYPLIKLASEVFIKTFDQGGFNSKRSGKLLYTISLDREYTKNLEATEELKTLKETYPYEQWVNIHVTPPPLELPYPPRDINCVKNTFTKMTEIVGIEAANVENFKKVRDNWYRQKNKLENSNKSIISEQIDEFSNGFGSIDRFGDRVWLEVRDKFLREDLKRIVIQAVACLMQKVDQATFLQFAKDFAGVFQSIKKALVTVFCNPEFLFALNILSFIKIPRIDTSNPLEQLGKEIENALFQLIIDIYSLIIKAFIALIQMCQDPASPFNALNDLDLNNAIDNALSNANATDNPDVSNMYDALGYPDDVTSGASEESGGIGSQTGSRVSNEDKDKIKQFIGDVACLTSTAEFCSLMVSGILSQNMKDYISNILVVKYPEFADVLGTNGVIDTELLRNLLTKIGKALNIYDICVSIEEAGPGFAQVYCADSALSEKERNALANRDIPPETLEDILNDVKKRRQKDLEEAAKAIEEKIAKEVPLFCTVTEDGQAVPGLVNVAKADDGYTRMFKNNLKSCMSDIVASFNSDIKDWRDNIFIRDSAIGVKLAGELAKLNLDDFNNLSEEAKKAKITQLLVSNNIIEDQNGTGSIGRALLPASGQPIVNFIVAPNVSSSLESQYFDIKSNKLTFETSMKEYRDQYISISLSNINAAANNSAKQKIEKARQEFNKALGNFIVDFSTGVVREIQEGKTIDFPPNDATGFSFSSDSLNAFEQFLQIVSYIGAVVDSLFISVGSYYSTLEDNNLQLPGAELPKRNIKLTTDEKTKIVPPPSDKPPAPVVQELQLGGPNKLIPPNIPPMDADQMFVMKGETLAPISKFTTAIKNSTVLGPFVRLLDASLKSFDDLLFSLKEEQSGLVKGYQEIAQINASFPDYKINYEFGLKPPFSPAIISQGPPSSSLPAGTVIRKEIRNTIIDDNGRIKNYYNLFISQSVHNSEAPSINADGTVNTDSYTATKYKQFLTQTNFELIDKELSDFIISFAPLEGYLNSSENKSLQEYVFNSWKQKQPLEIKNDLDFTYEKILNKLVHAIRLQTQESLFFKNRDSTLLEGSNSSGTPSIPYLFYLDLVESSTEQAQIQCGIDKNLLDTDDIIDNVVDEFVNNACNFEAPPVNPSKKRKNMNPVEKNSSNGIIKATIRVYLYDYYLKGLFPLDTIRPAFVYDNLMAEFFALQMESEMKAINQSYFEDFINAAQKYYDERTVEKAEDLLLPQNTDMFIKRTKLAKLIKEEILQISKRLGTKIREVDISARNELFDKKRNSPKSFIRANDEFPRIRSSIFLLSSSEAYRSYDGARNIFLPEVYPVVTDKNKKKDIFKNASSPYAIFSLLNEKESFLNENVFRLSGTANERFKKYQDSTSGQALLYKGKEIITDVRFGKNLEFRTVFEFLFPLRKIYSLMIMHNVLASNSRPEVKKAFSATKSKLAGIHSSFMSRPRSTNIPILPASVVATQMASGNFDFAGELKDVFKKFFIKALLETPRKIVKGSVEAGGDLNGFLASLPYTIYKPIHLAINDEVPFKRAGIPMFAFTPGFSLIYTLMSLSPFFLPLRPNFLTIAYLVTLGWWDTDWFINRNRSTQSLAASAEGTAIFNTIAGAFEGEIDCEAVRSALNSTFEGNKLINISNIDNKTEIE